MNILDYMKDNLVYLDGGMGTASDSKDRNTDSARGCRRHYLSGCRQPGI